MVMENDDAVIAELVIADLIVRFGPVSVETALSQAIDELRSETLRQYSDLHDAIVMRRSIELGQTVPGYDGQLRRIIDSRTC